MTINYFKKKQSKAGILMLVLEMIIFTSSFLQAQCTRPTYPISACESYTLTAQMGLTHIQWYVDSGTGKQAIAGANAAVLVANTEGVYSYTARDANDCPIELCCPFTFVTTPLVLITNQPNPIVECVGGTALLYAAAAAPRLTNAGLTYQWQESTDSLNWADIPNSNTPLFTPLSNQVGKKYYRAGARVSGYTCPPVYTRIVSVSVVQIPHLVSVTTVRPTNVCPGNSLVLQANLSNNLGMCGVQWFKSEDDGVSWYEIPNATSLTYQTPPMQVPTKFLANLVCSGSGCCR
jgi:hypothetical protein